MNFSLSFLFILQSLGNLSKIKKLDPSYNSKISVNLIFLLYLKQLVQARGLGKSIVNIPQNVNIIINVQ